MGKNLTLYCSSSTEIDSSFIKIAEDFAIEMVKNGFNLVYGGANIGIMGAVAKKVHELGAKIIGVIPKKIYERGLGFELADELHITSTMAERKTKMIELGDLYVALPGGIGTIEELTEVISLKQLKYHTKPIIILNINDCFTPLLEQFKQLVDKRFSKKIFLDLFFVTSKIEEVFSYIKQYTPPYVPEKWWNIQKQERKIGKKKKK